MILSECACLSAAKQRTADGPDSCNSLSGSHSDIQLQAALAFVPKFGEVQRTLVRYECNRAPLSLEKIPRAAPAPIARFLYQAGFHRIAVHVLDFLNCLVRRENIEWIVSFLPEMNCSAFIANT